MFSSRLNLLLRASRGDAYGVITRVFDRVDHSLLERMTTLSGEIVNRFNVYRVEINGETLSSNQVRDITKRRH